MRIDITPVNLTHQRVKESGECFIELTEYFFRYRMEFVAEEPKDLNDEELGWEYKKSDWDVYAKIESIVAVEKWKCTNIDRWKVIISLNGMASDLTIYFRKQDKCEIVFKEIINHLFNGNPDKGADK